MIIKKKIKRVLLISPHYTIIKNHYKTLSPPLGLAYIAAVLEQEGYTVGILDVAAEGFKNDIAAGKEMIMYGLSFKDIEKRIVDFNPQVVGVSCLISSQFNSLIDICKIAKKINKDIITLAGGEHPSALPEDCLKESFIDFVIIGEGEQSTLELLNSIGKGKDISKIDGLGFKRNRKIIVNPKTRFIENLDKLPFPARHLLPMDVYFKVSLPQGLTYMRVPNTSIITSRGCSANCIFCATTRFWGNKHRARSANNVLSEIEHLVKKYGIKELQFLDDNLTLDKRRAIEIFKGMQKRFDLAWSTPQGIAAWALDKELLGEMKKSGCYEVTLAIESGDQYVLNHIIGKPGNIKKIKEIVREAKELDIMVKGFFVVGLPGENKEQISRTFKFAQGLDLDSSSFFMATPLPGTKLYDVCKEKGYLRKGFNFNCIDYKISNIETPEFSGKELENLVFKNMLRLNLNLLMKNPVKFIKKYSKLFFNNPKIMIDYTIALAKKLI